MTKTETSQQPGENTSQNKPLIEREQIEGTPFTLVNQNEQYFIVMGDHRLTEPTKNKNTQIIKLENEKWLILTQVIIIVLEKMNEKAEMLKARQEQPYVLESL